MQGLSDTFTVRFIHIETSEGFAIHISDCVRSFAIWSEDLTTFGQALTDAPVAEDHPDFQTADSGSRLTVTRGCNHPRDGRALERGVGLLIRDNGHCPSN